MKVKIFVIFWFYFKGKVDFRKVGFLLKIFDVDKDKSSSMYLVMHAMFFASRHLLLLPKEREVPH